MARLFATAVFLAFDAVLAFTPGSSTRTFASFGNAQTKELIQAWKPSPLNVPSGDVLLPSSTENLKRFVRARIMLEQDPSLGCFCAFTDEEQGICVILSRFSKAEHQLLLPLWRPSHQSKHTFGELLGWHKERFGGVPDAPRLSGAHLESDREAWAEVFRP